MKLFLFIMAQVFFDLSFEEILSIRWHMGKADPGAHFFYPTGTAYTGACKETPWITLLILKKRADEARPMMESAEGAKISAESEVKALESMENCKTKVKDAENKLKIAQEKLGSAERQLDAANTQLNATKPIPTCENAIQIAQNKIESCTKNVAERKSKLESAEGVLAAKTQKVTEATTVHDEAAAAVSEIQTRIDTT